MEVAALKRQQSPRAQVQSPLSVRQVHLPKDRGATQMAWSPGEEDAKLARSNGHKLQ
ncbi:HCN2, partial [Symbiodinium sp. KB8]